MAEALIEDHDHLAKLALGLIEALGLSAIGFLLLSFSRLRLPLWGAALLGVPVLGNCAVLAQTAHLGGQIRHSEIRSGVVRGEQAESGDSHDQGAKPDRDAKEDQDGDHDDD